MANYVLDHTGQQINTKLTKAENIDNKVTSLSSSSTNIQYPSAKCVYDNTAGYLPINFEIYAGLINASKFSLLYPHQEGGNAHTYISVSPGEEYIITCRSNNSTYPGVFYTLNNTFVSSIFTDTAQYRNVAITIPSGVDTLWINNQLTVISLEDWKIYKIISSKEYNENNKNNINILQLNRLNESIENMRRLKNLESLYNFKWKPFDKAYYCFINDGTKQFKVSGESYYDNWVHVFYDVFHNHGLPFCAATVGEKIKLKYGSSFDQPVKDILDAVVADGGEIMVYLNAHATDLTTYEGWYNKAIRDGKRMIESYGYNVRGLILSNDSPTNSINGQKICEQYFDYADHVGTIGTQYDIRREQFSDTSTVADVKTWIDNTVNTPGFYPVMMHGTYMEPWASAEGMDEILTYIEGKGNLATVSTYGYVFDTFKTNGFLTLNDLPIYNGGVL